jgi:dual-specificity kinase
VVQELISGGTLYDELRRHGGYSLYFTQGIAKQLLAGLAHIHKCDVLHTDIKTDNIMIDGHSSDGTPLIKIVDLGSAITGSSPHPNMIGTKEYRAPEAVLQAGWSSSVDVWALGCCIFEVRTGRRLFEFDYEITQLYMMERVLGTTMPGRLVRRGVMNRNKHNTYLLATDACALAHPVGAEVNKIYAAKPLWEEIGDRSLRSLLQLMLAMDPEERPSAKALQRHAFCVEAMKAPQPREEEEEEALSECSTLDSGAEGASAEGASLSGTSAASKSARVEFENELQSVLVHGVSALRRLFI